MADTSKLRAELLIDAQKALSTITQFANSAESKIQGIGNKATIGKNISNQIVNSFDDFGSRMKGIFDFAFGNLLANSVSNGIGAIKGFLGSQLQGAQGLESTRTALNGIIGDSAKAGQLLNDVVKFAAETPFEIPELASTAQQLAAAGFGADEITGSLKKLGEVASGTNKPIGQIAYVYGQIKTANIAYTQDLNQLQTAGVPVFTKLGESMGKNTEQIKKLASEGKISFADVDKVITGLTSKGGIFFEAMAKQSKILGGLLSTLSDTFGGIGRKILGLADNGDVLENRLFDKLRQGTAGLIAFLSTPTTLDFFKSIGDQVSGVIDLITKLDLKKTFDDLFGKINFNGIIDTIKQTFSTAFGFVSNIASQINFNSIIASLGGLNTTISNLFNQAGENQTFKNLIGAISSGIVNLINYFPKIIDFIGQIITFVGKIDLKPLIDGVGDFFSKINFADIISSIASFGGSLANLFNEISKNEVVKTIINSIKDGVVELIKYLPDVFKFTSQIIDYLANNKAVLDGLVIAISAIGTGLLAFQVLNTIAGFITTFSAGWGVLTTAITTAGGVISYVTSIISGLLIGINPVVIIIAGLIAVVAGLYLAWQTNFLGIQDITKKALEGIKQGFSSFVAIVTGLWNSLTTTLSGVFDSVFKSINSVVTSAFNFLKGIFNGFVKDITNIWTGLTTFLNTSFEIAKNFLVGSFNLFVKDVTNIWNGLTSFLGNAWNLIFETIKAVLAAEFLIIIGLFTGNGQLVQDTLNGLGAKLGEIWGSTLETIKNITLTALLATGNFFNDLKNNTIATLISFKDGTIATFVSLQTETINTFNSLKDSVITTFINLKNDSINTFISLRDGLGNTFNDLKNNITNAVIGLGESIKNNFNNTVNFLRSINLGQIGADLIAGLINGILSNIGNIENTIRNSFNSALNFLRSINLYEIGTNMISGLINGILSNIGNVANTIRNGLSNAIEGAKDILKINSPSKVFMEIGGFTGEGLVMGLKKVMPAVEKAFENLVTIPEAPQIPASYTQPALNQNLNSGYYNNQTTTNTSNQSNNYYQYSSGNNQIGFSQRYLTS